MKTYLRENLKKAGVCGVTHVLAEVNVDRSGNVTSYKVLKTTPEEVVGKLPSILLGMKFKTNPATAPYSQTMYVEFKGEIRCEGKAADMRPSRGIFNWTLRPSSACWERSRCVLGGLSFSSIPLLRRRFMSLSERLSEVVRACFSGIWIESHEHDEAMLVTELVVQMVHRINTAVTPAKRCGTSQEMDQNAIWHRTRLSILV